MQMQMWAALCWALLAAAAAVQCPDAGRCGDGETCCSDPEHGYECCPFDQAECCSDHVHCCPAGTTCDALRSSCVNATASVPWVERTSADQPRLSRSFRMIKSYVGDDEDNVCPDQSRCPPEFSCLKTLTRFGCCPLAQGVSCSDGKHCCPEGHECSADGRSCIRQDHVTTVLCGDGVSECPDQTTCCETLDGKWGCCPMPKAVCCEDKLHCCPEGSSCDQQSSKCISSSTGKETPMWAKLPARTRAAWEDQEEAKHVTAQTADNSDSEQAPEVTTANQLPPSQEEAAASSVSAEAAGTDVPCDSSSSCADNTTCCKTEEGDWACCPMPEAVCCEDFIHCCPKGKKCNVAAQRCDDGTSSTPWMEKTPAMVRQDVEVEDVPCDSSSSCADNTTCCKTEEGDWACCPLPEAVCCEDFIHCCPKGKKCNMATQRCDDGTSSTPWMEKTPAMVRQDVEVEDVPCDSSSSCPDNTTCCKNKEDLWACCPLPEAVCCADHEHCCPSGSTCDPSSLSCLSSSGSVPMLQRTPAFTTPAPATPDFTTPAPATPDFTIPVTSTTQTEEQGGDDGDYEDKDSEDVDGSVQCDSSTSCPEFSTCCFMASSKRWGCCPLPEAVCCSDGNHCCPKDYWCNEQDTSCSKGDVVIPWYTKLPAVSDAEAKPGAVQCDGGNRCPEHTSCCRLFTGEWGCCPLENAVCCPDKEHCCPQGYSCNIASRSCQKVVLLQLETVPLTPVFLPVSGPTPHPIQHQDVKCDDKTSCKDQETCCRTSATTWACCPAPNAVCCSDMRHCCPNGFTCTEEGQCIQNSLLHWNNWHWFLPNKKRSLVV